MTKPNYNREIAIIGIAGYFPEAESVLEFFENLKAGKDSVRPLSSLRQNLVAEEQQQQPRIFGYLDNIHRFDYRFFGLSQAEAELMDPQQRLALEVAYQTFENAAINVDDLRGSNTSVYINHAHLDYHKLAGSNIDPMLVTGSMSAAISGRIARHFDLRGKALMVDTTCSSALVALNLAINDILLGDSDQALIMGVNINVFPSKFWNTYSNLGIHATDGKTKSFAENADGTGWGEVVCGVLLKPLDKAIEAKHTIHAVIKGAFANQDAALSSSLTASSSHAQADALTKAWEKSGVDPESITFIEAHGTGTKLGDPIEIEGMNIAFRKTTSRKKFCAVSSVKSNIGHTNNAAGLVGLIKTVLSLRYQWLPPSIHCEKRNAFIDFETSAVYVNTESRPWISEEGTKRIAGVSSFGLSGTNCHVVLEENQQPHKASSPRDGYMITLSGFSPASLTANRESLQKFLSKEPSLSISDISFTTTCHRKHYGFRFAAIVNSIDQLKSTLGNGNGFTGNFQPQKVFVVFSHCTIANDQLINAYSSRHPAFEKSMKKIYSAADFQWNNETKAFAFQYSCYTLLETLGIAPHGFLHDGLGEVTFRYISGQLTEQQAVEELKEYSDQRKPNFEARIEQLLIKETQSHRTLFIECGPDGSLTALLRKDDNPNIKVVSIDNDLSGNQFLLDLYLAGLNPNVKSFFNFDNCVRVELPPYQFDRAHCWINNIEKNELEDGSPASTALHELNWQADASTPVERVAKPSGTIVLIGNSQRSSDLAKMIQLRSDHAQVLLLQHKPSNDYYYGSDNYCDVTNNSHIENFFASLEHANKNIGAVIFAVDPANEGRQLTAMEGLFTVTRALCNFFERFRFNFLYVSTKAVKVLGNEKANPAVCAQIGFLKSLKSEFTGANIKALDFDNSDDLDTIAKTCLHEISNDYTINFAAYRNAVRFVPGVQQITRQAARISAVKPDGAYIVTGGASGVGLAIARHIAIQQPSAIVILIGRRAASDPQIQKAVVELQRHNKNIYYKQADISRRDQAKEVFDQIYDTVSKVEGVFHCAGILGERKSLGKLGVNEFIEGLRAKIEGTEILLELIRPLAPSYLLMTSSLNSVFPRKDLHGYATANAFLDAVGSNGDADFRMLTLNLPGWKNVGMDVYFKGEYHNDENVFRSPEEGVKFIFTTLDRAGQYLAIKGDVSKFHVNPFLNILSPTDATTEIIRAGEASIEDTLVEIWKQVLKSDAVNFKDDFFELGGHSLNATQLLLKIKNNFQVEIEFDDLFEYPTVEALAEMIKMRLKKSTTPSFVANEKPQQSPDNVFNTTPAQQSIWLLENGNKNQIYLEHTFIEIEGKLDIQRLQTALSKTIDRHESFRTTFHFTDDRLLQKVHQSFDLSKIFRYHSGLEGPREEFINAILAEKFDLELGPLVRLHVWKNGNSHELCMVTHHLISDGWSMNIFSRDLINYYRGQGPQPSEVSQYREFVEWRSKNNFDRPKQHWAEVFAVPFKKTRTSGHQHLEGMSSGIRAETIKLAISPAVLEGMSKQSAGHKISLFAFNLAAVFILLNKLTDSTDLVVGCPANGRTQAQFSSTVGLFVNTLPIRKSVKPQMRVSHFLVSVGDTVTQALSNQNYPLASLVKDLGFQRDTSGNPLFDVGFTWHEHELEHIEGFDDIIRITKKQYSPQYALETLWFHGLVSAGGLDLHLSYSPLAYNSDDAALIADMFAKILDTLSYSPHVLIQDLLEQVSLTKNRGSSFDFNYSI